MRNSAWLMMGLVATCAASQAEASASFANRSLGLSVSAFKLVSDSEPVDFGIPIQLEGGYYIDNGFELFLRIPFMLLYQKIGVTGAGGTGGGFVLGTGGQFGTRYLFLEESLRPYVELHLAALYIFRDNTVLMGTAPNFLFGPGAGAGLDYFIADSISLGVRAYVDLFIALNSPLRFSLGGGLNLTTYF